MHEVDITCFRHAGAAGVARSPAWRSAQGRHPDRRRRSDDRPVRDVRRADEGRRRAGGDRHQRQGRRSRPEAGARGRRRCLRSEAGGRGRQPDGGQGRQADRRTLLLGLLDPGLGRLLRGEHHPDLAGLDQSEADRSRARRTSSAPAAATISRASSPATTSPTNSPDKKIAIVHDKQAYSQGSCRRDEEAAEHARHHRRCCTRRSPRARRTTRRWSAS